MLKLDSTKGYPMLLKKAGTKVMKVEEIVEERPAKVNHDVPATFYSVKVIITQDVTPVKKPVA